jgi:Cupredoxin-like domain
MASSRRAAAWPTGSRVGFAAAMLVGLCLSTPVAAQDNVELVISVKDHKFDPPELQAPAGKPIVLRVKNLDPTPMEFESKSLKVEKVLSGNSEAVVNIRAQKAGRYEFFDEFHEKTTRGFLVVK